DGGGIRGLSELCILSNIMWRIKTERKLETVPRPCEYFDMIAGTSTGGLIALMVGRLRLSVDEAIAHYTPLAENVFSDIKPFSTVRNGGKFKATKLEEAIQNIVKKHATGANAGELALLDPDPGYPECKTFVCAMPAANMNARKAVHFRTYAVPHEAPSTCAIWEAGRATSAAPTFFKPISVATPTLETFIDGGLGCNNPTQELLDEAKLVFPGRRIACVVSIGTGHAKTIAIPPPGHFSLQQLLPADAIKAMIAIATDCETVAEEMAKRFGDTPGVYWRFNVEQGMQKITLAEWEKMSEVATHTNQYIRTEKVSRQLTEAVHALVNVVEEPILR
ncbi:hypothetical protein PLICRDRAFT_107777, partial [Plicaturopsis crispa FD-325 SS-3]